MLQASSTASDGARVDWRWLGRRIFLLALLMLGAVGTESAAAPTETKLLDPLGSANASFGHDAALSGNYAIVGARYDATQGFDGGKAVIFGFDGSQWQVQSHLLPPASSDYATFAQSVDISGDYAIVGTPYLGEHDANQTGSATIYVRSGTTWTQQAVLVGSDTAKGDRFGYSVAIDGDYALVGAPDHAALGADAGATYVFLRSGASWSQQAKLLASDGAADMEFGSDVALSGARAVVGVDIQAPGPNYAYSFERTTTLWTQTARFKAGDVIDSDRFGASLALSGPTLIAGAYFHGHPPSIGSAYAFDYVSSSGGWVERKEFLENSTLIDFLGFAVGLDGDLAGVGAVNADGNQPSSGVANFYRRTPYGGWAKSAKVSASDTIQYHAFGHAIGISGDCAIVGAIHDTSMGTNAGAAYVYCGFPIPLVEIEIHVICCFQIPDFGTGGRSSSRSALRTCSTSPRRSRPGWRSSDPTARCST
jgi:hypothetical protein